MAEVFRDGKEGGIRLAGELATVGHAVVIFEKPRFFRAIAEANENRYDVPDEEVIRIVEEYRRIQEAH